MSCPCRKVWGAPFCVGTSPTGLSKPLSPAPRLNSAEAPRPQDDVPAPLRLGNCGLCQLGPRLLPSQKCRMLRVPGSGLHTLLTGFPICSVVPTHLGPHLPHSAGLRVGPLPTEAFSPLTARCAGSLLCPPMAPRLPHPLRNSPASLPRGSFWTNHPHRLHTQTAPVVHGWADDGWMRLGEGSVDGCGRGEGSKHTPGCLVVLRPKVV